MRRPVRVQFTAPASGSDDQAKALVIPAPDDWVRGPEPGGRPAEPVPLPRFTFPGGLTNQQVWAAAQDELAGRLTPASYETWVRPAALIAQDDDGSPVIGAPNVLAQRRLTRLLPEIESVLGDILGEPARARVVITSEWLQSVASERRSS
jgi:hypothetical protein